MIAGAHPAPTEEAPAGGGHREARLYGARCRFTGRAEGDMGHGGGYVERVRPDVEARRREVLDRPWTWLRQVHGDRVVLVRRPGDKAGAAADAAVSDHPGVALAVLTADCAPVFLASPEGPFGVVHAGWVGLVAGVVERAVERMRAMGAAEVGAIVGPCIRAECYEFGPADLDRVVARLGDGARSRTSSGAPALDLAAGVRAALGSVGVDRVEDVGTCTACSGDHFSWRARRERQRQAAVAWR